MGDVCYRRGPEHLKAAATHWLRAWMKADRPSMTRTLAERVLRMRQADPADRALMHFHLASYTLDVPSAQRLFARACRRDDTLEQAMLQLMLIAADNSACSSAYRHFHTTFSALLSTSMALQHDLVAKVLCRSWSEVAPLAGVLRQCHAHLLAPRCAAFLALIIGASPDGEYEEDEQMAAQAREVMAFVRELDGDGHLHAMGALESGAYQTLWSLFLDAWTMVEPTAFGGFYDRFGDLHEPAPEDRFVEGLPYTWAVMLPFNRTWAEVAEFWRSLQAGQAAAVLP